MWAHVLTPKDTALLRSDMPSLPPHSIGQKQVIKFTRHVVEGATQEPGSQDKGITRAILETGKCTKLFSASFICHFLPGSGLTLFIPFVSSLLV